MLNTINLDGAERPPGDRSLRSSAFRTARWRCPRPFDSDQGPRLGQPAHGHREETLSSRNHERCLEPSTDTPAVAPARLSPARRTTACCSPQHLPSSACSTAVHHPASSSPTARRSELRRDCRRLVGLPATPTSKRPMPLEAGRNTV